jgi:hypothetical protein
MPDRETSPDKNAASSSAPKRSDDRQVSSDDDTGEANSPDSPKSTASRPRGQTEEPDRTL